MSDSKIKLYDMETLDERINYLKSNGNLLDKYENIRDVIDDYYGNIYILLEDGSLYINDTFVEKDISFIHLQDTTQLYAISNDNRVIPLLDYNDSLQQYISNNSIPYKEIICSYLSIVCLTTDGFIRFISSEPNVCVDYNNLVNVKEIDYLNDEDAITISHDGENFTNLFI